MGVVNVVKTWASGGAPSVTGYMAGAEASGFVFVVAGTLKASYDLGMLCIFSSFQVPNDA